ncbi:MAG: BMP family protein [Myxococcales bacterium]|nr:BMP family protein [Myxococcales bacterium]
MNPERLGFPRRMPRLARLALPALVAAMAAAALGGCSKSKPADAPKAAEKGAKAFKVALLSPGPVSDAGWNASAYEGLLHIRDELGAQVSQVETKSPAEFDKGFRDYAQRGYALVFGHGFEFQDAAARAGADFPGTVFITTSGSTVRPNVAPIVFELEQATYLMGMVAGLMSEGATAAIGGVDIPSIRSTFLAYGAGAKRARPQIRVIESFIGSWEDVGAAKEATLAAIQQGARFVFHNADAAGLGVFQAVRSRPGTFAFGSNKNQNDVAPDVVLASAVLDIPAAFVAVAREVKEGRFAPRVHRLGMAEGIVSLVWNDRLKPKVPADVLEKVEAVRKEIVAGTFEVPRGDF